jgi:hypothetical protein
MMVVKAVILQQLSKMWLKVVVEEEVAASIYVMELQTA